MEFKKFRDVIEAQFKKMAKGDLYVVNKPKDDVWERYLDAFPDGTNELYKERREYDCNFCKQFLRHVGNVVSVQKGKLVSVWDVEVEGYYKDVVENLSKYVKSGNIAEVFLHNEVKVGVSYNIQLLEDGTTKKWNHFSCELPSKFVTQDVAAKRGSIRQRKEVFARGLKEITPEAIEIVLDLIKQKSIYRGEEFQKTVQEFAKLQKAYVKVKSRRDIFEWENAKAHCSAIRNTVIGSLLTDLSEGKGIDISVASFEAKVAPTNYKRTSAPVTKGMIEKAVKKIEELGIEPALHRRYAQLNDISVNNVLFVDRSVTPLLKDSLTATLMSGAKSTSKSFDKVEEIGIEEFLENVLPQADSVEVYMENKHTPNLVSLIAPTVPDAPLIFKWDSDFSWSYFGEITDSMKERVKSAGGSVTGDLRFSIQWNEELNDKSNDLDAHCRSPKSHIYYSSKRGSCGGKLDVDITSPSSRTAVENITWAKKSAMPDGSYDFYVHNYSGRNKGGFRAEVEIMSTIYSYNCDRSVTSDVKVATVTLKNGEFTIIHHLDEKNASKDAWGLKTENFQKVDSVMLSPNHWDGQKIGNKHYMFMLADCVNPDETRGIYNEFLKGDLTEYRKVFELLGDKIKCPKADNQLSGLGFSSTTRNELICKVTGNFTRTLKIKF